MNYTPPIKVKVYWNLHKKVFSVQHKGIVIAHMKEIYLSLPTFKVSEAGRQRVLRTQKKNVHAFVEGWWNPGGCYPGTVTDAVRMTYNPYRFSTFVTFEGGTPADSSAYYAVMCRKNEAKNSPEIFAYPRPTT